jgi:hypothetical protein
MLFALQLVPDMQAAVCKNGSAHPNSLPNGVPAALYLSRLNRIFFAGKLNDFSDFILR